MLTWLALTLALALVTSLAIWSRYPTRARGLSVIALLATAPLTGAILVGNGGWSVAPYPYLSELPAETQILGAKIVQDEAIYLMLDVDGEPRLFKLPWSTGEASKLQRLMEAGEANGGSLTAKRGDKPDDYPVEFWATPQPSMPDKQPEAAAPTYQRQG